MPAPASPFYDGKDWFYNENTGEIQHIHAGDVAGVATNPEWYYFAGLSYEVRFATQAEAEAYKQQHPPSHKSILDPTNPNNPLHVPDPGSVASSVTNDLLKPLFQAHIWLRVGEVALGLILIAVGVARMTNAVPLATKIAGVVK